MPVRVLPVACLSDNYAYLVWREGSRAAVVIDPSESEPVLEAARSAHLQIVAILDTHHHPDHVGGNEGIVAKLGKVPVYAHASDKGRIPAQSVFVEEGHPFEVAGIEWTPLHVPGHTLGAVSYWAEGNVFTGDTLFVAGCGRLFEGTAAQMHSSLNDKLGGLPHDTKVYCGHEYTVNNLRFAASVEPNNRVIAQHLATAQARRAAGEPTVPSTIAEERATNPFLRCREPAILAQYPAADEVSVFAAVRRAKDSFR